MIFVTVGTEKFPFERLLRIIEAAVKNREIQDEVFAQVGSTKFASPHFSCVAFLEHDKWVECVKKADIVVSHAGQGSIFLSLSLGKIPIVFPRRAQFKEHLDDHQMESAKKMEEKGKIVAAYTAEELIRKVTHYKELVAGLKASEDGSGRKRLIEFLRQICSSP